MWKFAHSPLDRLSHKRSDNAWLDNVPEDKTIQFILFNERYQVLMQTDAVHPVNAQPQIDPLIIDNCIYLGDDDKHRWFCAKIDSDSFQTVMHQQWMDLRVILSMIAEPYASIVAYGKALVYWHRYHQYCGKCGGETRVEQSGHQRICHACDNSVFPRTDPAIIVAVTYQDQLLLARQSSWPKNRYSVLAGFVEPGESFEQAVKREVFEEAHLPVSSIRYIGSQPWPFPCSVMIGFTARAKHQNVHLLDDELEEAIWVSPDSIIEQLQSGDIKLPTTESISCSLIEHWADQYDINLQEFKD